MANLSRAGGRLAGLVDARIRPADIDGPSSADGAFALSPEHPAQVDIAGQLAMLVQSSRDAIVTVALDCTYTSWSPGAEAMFGYSAEEMIGERVGRIVPDDKRAELDGVWDRVLAGESIPPFETVRVCKNGDLVDVSMATFPLRDPDGAVVGGCTIHRDIGPYKRAEALYRAVSELATDYAYSMRVTEDRALEWEWVTDGFTRVTGFTPDELDERGGWPSLIHPDDLPPLMEKWAQIGTPDYPPHITFEFRIITKSGDTRCLKLHVRQQEEGGRVVRLIGAAQDVTDQRTSHDALMANEERFRSLVQGIRDAIVIMDEEARVSYASPQVQDVTGFSLDEVVGQIGFDFVHPEDVPKAAEALSDLVAGRVETVEVELRVRHRDGHYFWGEVRGTNHLDDPSIRGIVVVYHDVTERKEAERVRARMEEMFRAASDLTTDWVYAMKVEPDGTIAREWITGGFEHVTGYEIGELDDRGGWHVLIHPDDAARVAAVASQFGRPGSPDRTSYEFRICTKSGETRWLRSHNRVVTENGRPTRLLGVVQDITETRASEHALRESEQRYRGLFDGVPVGIFRTTPEGRTIDANDALVKLLGFNNRDEMYATPVMETYLDPQDRLRWTEHLEREGVVEDYETRLVRRDGGPIWVRITARVVRDEQGAPLYYEGVLVDVTERKRAEDHLKQALNALRRNDEERRKLLTHLVRARDEERKRVAAGIHDDSIQLMTSVAIELERWTRKAREPELVETLGRLERSVRGAISRLRNLVFDLRPPSLDTEGLIPALTLVLEELKVQRGIEYQLTGGLESTLDHETRFTIFRIAQEAINNVRKHSRASNVKVRLDGAEGGVVVLIQDDGLGFRPIDARSNQAGHIGLAEMKERAEKAGGTLTIDAAPGAGTRIEVWLPLE